MLCPMYMRYAKENHSTSEYPDPSFVKALVTEVVIAKYQSNLNNLRCSQCGTKC